MQQTRLTPSGNLHLKGSFSRLVVQFGASLHVERNDRKFPADDFVLYLQ